MKVPEAGVAPSRGWNERPHDPFIRLWKEKLNKYSNSFLSHSASTICRLKQRQELSLKYTRVQPHSCKEELVGRRTRGPKARLFHRRGRRAVQFTRKGISM